MKCHITGHDVEPIELCEDRIKCPDCAKVIEARVWTPVVNGERLRLYVKDYTDETQITVDGTRYGWKSAPYGFGCRCDAEAWVIA